MTCRYRYKSLIIVNLLNRGGRLCKCSPLLEVIINTANYLKHMPNLTKRDIVLQIYKEQEKCNNVEILQNDVKEIVQRTLDILSDSLAKGRNVELRNFGVLEVQVRTRRAPGVAAEGYGVAHLHDVALFHEKTGEVSVDGFQSVGMAHHHIVAVTAAFVVGKSHLPGKCGAHGVAYGQLDVYAAVHAVTAESVVRSFAADDGYAVVGHVDGEGVGQLHACAAVGVYPAVHPHVAVEFAGRCDAVFLFEPAAVCYRVVDAQYGGQVFVDEIVAFLYGDVFLYGAVDFLGVCRGVRYSQEEQRKE